MEKKIDAADAVTLLRGALMQAEYAIKGREHTGFITKALVATEHIAGGWRAATVAKDGETMTWIDAASEPKPIATAAPSGSIGELPPLNPDAVSAAVAAWRESTNHPASGTVDRWDIGRAIQAYIAAIHSACTPASAGSIWNDAEPLVEKLERVSRWIDKFPMPTQGATAMMCHLRDVIEAIRASQMEAAPRNAATPSTQGAENNNEGVKL